MFIFLDSLVHTKNDYVPVVCLALFLVSVHNPLEEDRYGRVRIQDKLGGCDRSILIDYQGAKKEVTKPSMEAKDKCVRKSFTRK